MNDITDLITENNLRHIFVSLIFIILFILLTLASNFIFKKLRNRALRSQSLIDDFIVRLFKVPSAWIIFSILLNIFSSLLDKNTRVYDIIQKTGQVLLILSIGWLIVQAVRAVFRYFQNKLDVNQYHQKWL